MHVTIIGAGYVGLTTGVCLAHSGHTVWLVEKLPERLATIRSGRAPFYEPGLNELLKKVLEAGTLCVTEDLTKAMRQSAATFIAVGTPAAQEAIDLSQVVQAAELVAQQLQADNYHVVVVKSTVVPGTTDGIIRKTLERGSGLKCGQFGLAMNPEFLREGTAVEDFLDPDRIVIGRFDERSGEIVQALYERFACPNVITTLRNAELIKYSSNALLALLISYSNELASICESLPGTDVDVVLDGLHLDRRLSPLVEGKRIKPQILSYLRAGIGFGGSCLPKDVNALRVFARERGIETPLLNATMQVNTSRSKQIVKLLDDALNGIAGKTVAVLGLSFKPNTDDLRDSPALKIIEQLKEGGAIVRAYDPIFSDRLDTLRDKGFQAFANIETALSGADAALLATAWDQFGTQDWPALIGKMHNPLLLDGRRMLMRAKLPNALDYKPIGVHIDCVAIKESANG